VLLRPFRRRKVCSLKTWGSKITNSMENKTTTEFIDLLYKFQVPVAGFPLSDDFLCALPASNIQRAPDFFAVKTTLNGEWATACAVFPALIFMLAGLNMASKNSEHSSP